MCEPQRPQLTDTRAAAAALSGQRAPGGHDEGGGPTAGAGRLPDLLGGGRSLGPGGLRGRHLGTLPTRCRCISAASALAYGAVAFAVARGGGGTQRQRTLLGAIAATMTIGTLPNLASRSSLERGLWTPYCVLTATLAWRARRLIGRTVP